MKPYIFHDARWINPPKDFAISEQSIKITTDSKTDFWQRSYYGFRNDNAPALLIEHKENFTFTTRVSFAYEKKYDQCGVIIYIDRENWCKASIEYETADYSRLGSVVTNLGYSDWATRDINTCSEMWYRLSRRGPDFLIESSFDGTTFQQMRVFHLHKLGETTEEMGKQNMLPTPAQPIRFGLYACSPLDSSFTAVFDDVQVEACSWQAHG
ncbi:MAG: DUF1349 domain-containing protein [Calditrichaeota bacterium]|nr:MAG: DUF1349 domain-containing protein [Calditrichota bacterium]